MDRADNFIKADLVGRLAANRSIEASKISVEVSNGSVTLRGEVPTDFDKYSAYYDALAVAGVTGVDNFLKINYQPLFIPPPDEEIENDIRRKLASIFQ